MAEQTILHERAEGISTITLNRPDKLNALTNDMTEALFEALHEDEHDPEVRAIVLRGAGRAFCAGFDLGGGSSVTGEMPRGWDMIDAQRRQMTRWLSLWNLRLPVIAAVHGHCLGAGFEIALHSDFVIAAPDARFGYPPVRATGLPDSQMFPFRLGVQWAKRLLYTGDSLDGETAERIGFALMTVPREDLDDAARSLARATLQVPLTFVQASKRVLNGAVERMGLQEAGAQTHYEYALALDAPEIAEFGRIAREQGIQAAIEWRNQGAARG